MRSAFGVLLLATLAGCGGKGTKPGEAAAPAVAVTPRAAPVEGRARGTVPPACEVVREHRDEDYTAGGLYAPGVSDSAPKQSLDIRGIPEPTPRDEPASAYGNRTPYTVLGKSYRVLPSPRGYAERGNASWYGQKFHGRTTSSREIYDMCSFSAAHKTLPLPSYVRVTRLDDGRSVVVRVNDRGPFHPGRVIDLSYAAAVKLGLDRDGTAAVEVQALDGGARLGGAPATAAPPRQSPVSGRGEARMVQVGAYREKANARRIAEQLEDAGVDDVDVDDIDAQGSVLWRVRVGPVKDSRLPGVLAAIRGLGLPEPRVVTE